MRLSFFKTVFLLFVFNLNSFAHLGWGLQFDSKGNLYFSDVINRRILKITNDSRLETISSNKWVHDLQIDENDNLYLGNEETSMGNGWYSLVKISSDGTESYLIPPTQNRDLFNGESFVVDSNGSIYNAIYYKIFKIVSNNPITFAGGEIGDNDGVGENAQFTNIWTMQILRDGNIYAVDDAGNSIRKITLEGEVTTVARNIINPTPTNTPFPGTRFNNAYGLDMDNEENMYLAYNGNGRVLKISPDGNKSEVYFSGEGWFPTGVAYKDNDLYILENNQSDQLTGNIEQRLVKLSSDSTVTILFENGEVTEVKDYGIQINNNLYKLHSNFPNPFNPKTNITFTINKEFHVKLDIYSVSGEHIVNLMSDFKKSGNYSVEWNGIDKYGDSVTSGVYYYTLRSGSFGQTKKMILLK